MARQRCGSRSGALTGGAMQFGRTHKITTIGGTCCATLLSLPLLSPQLAWPADAEPVPGGIVPQVDEGKRIYLPSQFVRFAPQTAADIVGQLPGFSVTNVSNNRGL